VNDISITEGNAGGFNVTMSNTTTGNVTVQYVLTAGSAASGLDYTYTGGTFTFAAGTVSGTIPVSTIQDTIFEGNETFTITLSSV